jgi:hypothetical protein
MRERTNERINFTINGTLVLSETFLNRLAKVKHHNFSDKKGGSHTEATFYGLFISFIAIFVTFLLTTRVFYAKFTGNGPRKSLHIIKIQKLKRKRINYTILGFFSLATCTLGLEHTHASGRTRGSVHH